ncbi:MAG: cytochrome-c oxidase, cbb3-type subunit III [Sulfurimicrobium sp.]|jgi:cytochrome c oxidase cbb3-type subunit 3|nr:cytochrome-c oxidase, cbb3-type subunit III [Sulfurimicrobium sp.]
MSDFVSGFWNLWVAGITLVSIIGCAVFLKAVSIKRTSGQVDTTGHVWDGDLAEWNNPLPAWWSWLFYITVVFSLVYLVLYPGLGSFKGIWGWSSVGQWEGEMKHAAETYDPIFNKFLQQDLKTVAADPEAKQMGQRLFVTYCSQCHGSDAGGSRGFPSLSDKDWLYGGDPETIKASILNGRTGIMPPHGPVLGDAGVKEVANYVFSLSGHKHDASLAAAGKPKFDQTCAACHMPEGTGMHALGAPNLTDKVWLYGSSEAAVIETIAKGRNGVMPAWKDFLSEAKIHLLAAYVYGLSEGK